jgi:hypothetical protein
LPDPKIGRTSEESIMGQLQSQTVLFDTPGPANTDRTLALAYARARELGLQAALVATTTGATGRQAVHALAGLEVVVVTHSTGFKRANHQELTVGNRSAIEAAGGRILTCQHAFGGVNRAVRKKLGSYQLDEIIAHTLRLWGEGTKVALEIALMATDAGLVSTDRPILSLGGTGRGADTALVIVPANAQAFFDLRILEVICRPAPGHPGFAGG